jgi:dienelactone hydrolase
VSTTTATSNATVDHIPVVWSAPMQRRVGAPLALWLPALGIDKGWVEPFLGELAEAGFVAVSFDPWQHGERGSESPDQIRQRVFGAYRRHKWPILGLSTLDALRVIDWATDTLGGGPTVVAGGISMGGEVAATLAGIDRRVERVAAIVASPDWTSPGMHGFDDPATLLEQGEADAYAQWFYDHLDPLTHLDAYARAPWIAFECGGADPHVPAEGALRFQAALRAEHPVAGERVRVTVHPGVSHLDGLRSPELHQRCLKWLLDDDRGS